MREKLGCFWKWKPDRKIIGILAVAALFVMLLPLLRLCEYAVPWFDDYGYALYVKESYAMPCTWLDALKGAVAAVVDEWKHWEGTYSAIFLGTLVPLIWGEEFYCWGPVFIILLLTISVFVLVGVCIRNVLKGDFWYSLILQVGCTGMVVMFIYSAQRGFYWYDGGVFYVAMSAFTMLFVAALIKLMTAQGRPAVACRMVLAMLAAVVVGGGNYVTTLQGLLLAFTFLALVIWKKRELLWRFVPVTIVYTAAFCMTVLAPGNSQRGQSFVGWGLSPIQAVLHSFVMAAEKFWDFTNWRTLAVLILLAPFMWQIVKKTELQFRYPIVVLLWSVCLYAATFTPGLYALGDVVLDRMLCTIKITLQLLLILNEIYLMGWFFQKKKITFSKDQSTPYWWFYPVMAAFMLLIFTRETNQAGNYSVYGAYYYIHTGEAYNFYQEYLARLEVLKSDEENVELEPYVWRPWFLYAGELSESPDSDRNLMIAEWYDKESVVCKSRETE